MMEDATKLMLSLVLTCAGGYDLLPEYADVFQKILDNDKLLKDRKWDSQMAWKAKYELEKAGM